MIVDEADHLHSQLRPVLDLARQRFAGVPGADDEHPLLHRRLLGTEAIAPDADEHARPEENQQREGPVDQQDAARRAHEPLPDAEQWSAVPRRAQNTQRQGKAGYEPDDVRDAYIAPPAAVEAKDDACQQLDADDDGHARAEHRNELARNDEIEAHEIRERIRGHEDQRVKEEQDYHAPGSEAPKHRVKQGFVLVAHKSTDAHRRRRCRHQAHRSRLF